MCGICGILNLDGIPVQRGVLEKMCKTLEHRGPDNRGIHIDQNIGLGHQRLSIIDLSEAANQPLSNKDSSIWIVYNGEIYNFREIRKELESKGYQFRSNSDTEVIIYAYEEWGIDCVVKFNGMFAFAIWDERKKRLVLVRDRIGIKPLFYYLDSQKLVFASEVKAILCDKRIKRKVDITALSDYLSLNYILAPHSIVKGVKKLAPSSILIWENGNVSIRNYWNLSEKFKEKNSSKSEDYYIERLRNLMHKSVERRLVSDVPLGAFLSGGIDSSGIVATMVDILHKPVMTFSMGFMEKTYSELNYARFTAQFLGTEHYDKIVSPQIENTLSQVVWYNDEPFADSSLIPMFFLAKFARERVKVVLSGDGGDENFAGYDTYIADIAARFYRRIFGPIHIPLKKFIDALPATDYKVSLDYKLKQFFSGVEYDHKKAHYWWRVIFSDQEKKRLLKKEHYEKIRDYDPCSIFKRYYDEVKGCDFLNSSLYVDIKTWLVDDILVKVDRASMAHSLEARVPYLDHEVVEFVAKMPSSLKLHRLRKKYILKKMLTNRIPLDIVNRKKSGFNAPISRWFKVEIKNFVEEILCSKNLKKVDFFDENHVRYILNEHYSGKRDNGLRILSLMNFILWTKEFL